MGCIIQFQYILLPSLGIIISEDVHQNDTRLFLLQGARTQISFVKHSGIMHESAQKYSYVTSAFYVIKTRLFLVVFLQIVPKLKLQVLKWTEIQWIQGSK